jgi:hypothetical protein
VEQIIRPIYPSKVATFDFIRETDLCQGEGIFPRGHRPWFGFRATLLKPGRLPKKKSHLGGEIIDIIQQEGGTS